VLFFPQPDPQVPQEEVSEHAREHVVDSIPDISSPHSDPSKAHPWLPQSTARWPTRIPLNQNKGLEARTRRRIADIVGSTGLVAERSFDHQPDGLLREPIARKNDLPLVELVLYRALVLQRPFACTRNSR